MDTSQSSRRSSIASYDSAKVTLKASTSAPSLRALDQESASSLRPENVVVVGGLGVGGFGVVVEVELKEPEAAAAASSNDRPRRLAMKCIPKKKYSNKRSRTHLVREIDMLTTMEPSNFLLRGHLTFETQTAVFLVTDFLGGGDLFFHLDQLLERGRECFSEGQARRILSEVSLGLVHLHNRGFVHLDMKIENVMLDSHGHVKIVDFGLALEIPPETDDAGGFVVESAGSVMYMPPEALSRTKIAGRFSDWWALGVVAHELLSGCSPWSSLSDEYQIRKDIATLIVAPPLGVSPAAASFILRLLHKDLRARLGTRDDQEVLASPFFASVDWEATEKAETPPVLLLPEGMGCVVPEDAETALREYGKISSHEGQATASPVDLGLPFASQAPGVCHRVLP